MATAPGTSQHCPRPGCSGVIEDGYCTVCGLAPPDSHPVHPANSLSAAPVRTGSAPSIATGGSGTVGTTGSTGSTRSVRSARSTRSTGSGRSSRRLGGGYLALPPVPPQDPVAALVPGTVPERKRYCSRCGAKLMREAGFCPKCGQEYSFIPTLHPGDVVSGKYEIKGTLAFGGLGWIYLAMDTTLSRWVVMKGLLNVKDPAMAQIAVREREFLAAVKHRSIVGIYDFITHGGEGFIVMEYVNGKTLLTLRREHGGPLPAWEAIAYILDLLPAFSYMDQHDLVYCDFKPENAMVEGDTVKVIDMGAVRRADDLSGDVFGSKGYTAPEASDDPTPVSDLYSVARALAVLLIDFDFQGKYEFMLPPPAEAPLFGQFPSLYRFLLKATRPNRDGRFQTAEEMAAQLVGVLREIVVGMPQDAGPIESAVFTGDGEATYGTPTAAARAQSLPTLKVDPADPVAGAILTASVTQDPARRYALLEAALQQHPDSVELQTRLADAMLAAGEPDRALEMLNRFAAVAPGDWRFNWYYGRTLLMQERTQEAAQAFDAVFDDLPGELAPKLALAHATEMMGVLGRALPLYDLVSRADPSLTTASFGLARCLAGQGDRVGAAEAYARVPATSSQYTNAQIGLARTLLAPEPAPPGESEVVGAATALAALNGTHDGLEVRQLSARILQTAAMLIEGSALRPDPARQVLGVPLTARSLRRGAEQELRACARFAPTRNDKVLFIDEANRVRPRTLL